MKPYYEHDGITIYHGDCLSVLRELPNESVNCCVTSPPYWGLRDYGTAQWEGGDTACDHKVAAEQRDGMNGKQPTNNGSVAFQFQSECGRCGARRIDSQLGLESTPDEYVQRMVSVFSEVRRVLRDDATVWLNLGDSYASAWAFNRRNVIGNGSLYPGAHFATFPEDLIKPCILAGCPQGGTVLDPFFGSGTTGRVALDCQCRCIGVELNQSYCDLAIKRFEQGVLKFVG